MKKNVKPWDDLDRGEKIKHIFDYPESMRDSQAKDLWGQEAYGYSRYIFFPPDASWKEIVEVIRSNHKCQCSVYIRLTEKDFKFFDEDDLKKLRKKVKNLPSKSGFILNREYCAYLRWREKLLNSSKPELLGIEFYDKKSLICRVCTEEGDWGDEYGFGVEPDMWACALFDYEGNTIQPFAPGYI